MKKKSTQVRRRFTQLEDTTKKMTNSLFNFLRYSAANPDSWHSNRTQRSLKVDRQFKEYIYHAKTDSMVSSRSGDSEEMTASDFPMRKHYCWNFSPSHENCFRKSTQSFNKSIVLPPSAPFTLNRKRFHIIRSADSTASKIVFANNIELETKKLFYVGVKTPFLMTFLSYLHLFVYN